MGREINRWKREKMTQWPLERERLHEGYQSRDPAAELSNLLSLGPGELGATFQAAVNQIKQGKQTITNLEESMREIADEHAFLDFPECLPLLMTWACVEALAKVPTLECWIHVRALKSHSWQLGQWMAEAMLLYAQRHPGTASSFVELAAEALRVLDRLELHSQFERHNRGRQRMQATWAENDTKLEDLWHGLQWDDPESYEEESPLFQVLCRLDFFAFQRATASLTNPYLLKTVLWVADVEGGFDRWAQLAGAAPLAFNADTTWIGNPMLPSLLSLACSNLVQASRHLSAYDAEPHATNNAKVQIVELSQAILAAVGKRADARALFARWSAWLMRQLAVKQAGNEDDVRDPAFCYSTLLETIGRQMAGHSTCDQLGSDAAPWEDWCHFAVLASWAYNEFRAVPDCTSWLQAWALKPDEWATDKGAWLRDGASMFTLTEGELPGTMAHLLAYPLAMTEDPVKLWQALWVSTNSLREVAEFGCSDLPGTERYSTRCEASKLLLLVFAVGLALLDQCVGRTRANPQPPCLATLQRSLVLAVQEMRSFDDTLVGRRWAVASRHVAVRRLIWEQGAISNGTFNVFQPADSPTATDHLRDVRNDVHELLSVLQMALINGVRPSYLRDALVEADIDLARIIGTARQLSAFDNRRYPFNETQFRDLSNAGLLSVHPT
jgi:hypothetical protein